MISSGTDISVVIVNYKVKEYIANLLNSLQKAQYNLKLQIFVVDNDSGDDSIAYLKKQFPYVEYIQNKENVGFGKANNQAIQKAEGKFTLIINPDTLVSEDTLTTLVDHMNKNELCGAAGCKILNPDGTFAPESRRSVPTIGSAASKVFGLNNLFPKSKFFGKYYMSWLDEDKASEVPVLSGSFMFWRTEVLQELDGFDERFFMYAEDIDLCYRLQQTKYHIDYVPETSIIHYKGESTKKGDLRYIRIFNQALYQFFEKHYTSRYSTLFRIFIYFAIVLKTIFSFFSTKFRQFSLVMYDLIFLNFSLLLAFCIRFRFDMPFILRPEHLDFLWINAILSALYLISAGIVEFYRFKKLSISAHLKALLISYVGIIIITFFARELAYSRLIFVFSFFIAIFFTITFRLFRINSQGSATVSSGRLRNARILIVGDEDAAEALSTKIHSRPDWSYEVVGFVSNSPLQTDSETYLGSLPQLRDLVNAYRIDQVFFALQSISYKEMLKVISQLQHEDVIFKLIPDSMDYILGKSNVEYLESIPIVEVDLSYSKPMNLFLKRCMDMLLSLPVYLILMLFFWPVLLFGKHTFIKLNDIKLVKEIADNKWQNRIRLLGYVVRGKLSLVGSPLYQNNSSSNISAKRGLTGLVQINQNRIQQPEDAESFELYYLQNYSIWMDIDILVKTIFKGPYILEKITEYEREEVLKNKYSSSEAL